MRRFIRLHLILTIFLLGFSLVACAQVEPNDSSQAIGKDSPHSEVFSEGLIFSSTFFNGEKAYYVIEYIGTDKDIIIPNYFNGRKVVGIGLFAFASRGIDSVKLSQYTAYVGIEAFAENNIREIEFPASIIFIERSAFSWNKISEIKIPESVETIGKSAFAGIPITNITILGNSERFNETWEDVGFPVQIADVPDPENTALYRAILESHNISFNSSNLGTTFQEEIELIHINGLNFYLHRASERVSFRFSGNGVWGPIIGVLTLENDVETIHSIRVIVHSETPNLGGAVGDTNYLELFVGRSMVPEIRLVNSGSDPDNPNEVDAIAGATLTSNRFQNILNEAYSIYSTIWIEHRD